MYFAARCSTGCRQSSALSEEGQKDEDDDRKTHRERKEHQGIKYMAKILMMAGSTVVVLSLLGFLVLLLKGRAVTKTSPVLMSLKALGIRPSEAEQRLCRQRVWVGNDTLMTPREQHFFRALLRHTSRKRWLLCPQVRVADIATLSPHIRPRSGPGGNSSGWHHSGTAMWSSLTSIPSLSSAQLNWMMPHTRKNTVSGAIFCWKRF